MKIKKTILCFLIMILIQSAFMLVGCKKNYDKVSIELDKTVMTLFLDDTLNQEGSNKLRATILGLKEDMVDSFSYLISDPQVASVEMDSKYENTTDFSVSAKMGGETEIYIISNETSTKTATVTLRVIDPLQNVEVDNTITYYMTIGNTEKTLSLTPSNVLSFTPETTSEKFFSFEVLNYNSEVAYYDNDTNKLIIKPEIEQGILELKAKFDFEKEKNTFGEEIYNVINEVSNSQAKSREDLIIRVYIVKEINSSNFTLSESGSPLSRTNGKFDKIQLVQNSSALCFKEVTASISEDLVNTEGFTYRVTANCITNNDMEVTTLTPEGTLNDFMFRLSAVFQNENSIIRFYVTIDEIDGFVQEFDLPFRIILIPEIIKINNDESDDDVEAVVYSRFQNNGTKFTVEIDPLGAEDRRFYINIPDDFASMIEIVSATDGITIKSMDVLVSGQSFYIRSRNNSIGEAYITIVSLGTSNYDGIPELTRQINLKLVIGAEEINTLLDEIYIEKGEIFNLEFSFDNNDAFTEYIYSKALDPTVCEVPDIMDGTYRSLSIYGAGVGITRVTIELSNGVNTTVTIICYMTFEDFGVSLPSANDIKSPVSEAIYTTSSAYDETKVKTVVSAKINLNSALYLSILPYNVITVNETSRYIYNSEALNPINYTQSFISSDTSILKIDSTGYMTCLKQGTVSIDCTLTVYVNAYDGQDSSNYGRVIKRDLTYTFTIDVVIPLESFEIIGSNISVYAYNRLSYYDQIQNYGTITLTVKIMPENATYNPADIIWTTDNIYMILQGSEEARGMTVTYNCYLIAGQNSQITSVNVALSANGKNYASSKVITIVSPRKVSYINLNNVPDYTLNAEGESIPYVYFDGRGGLNSIANAINLGAECVPANAFNTNVRYIVGSGLGDDPTEIIRVDEKGNIIPIANGYCYLYIVAEDWFTTATNYSDYENVVRVVAIKVADGKSKATAIDIKTAREFMQINSVEGLSLHYVLQANIDLTNYSDFTSFGLFEERIVENNITTTILNAVAFTGSIDAYFNVFGVPTQYKITGFSIKNTKYYAENSTSLYTDSSIGNKYTLYFGLFAVNEGEISNIIIDVSSVMITTRGLDDKATTNFGVLAGVNRNLIENCEVNISNLSGNDLYVNANTTFVNVGFITGLNQGYISREDIDGETIYNIYDSYVNNCISDGTLNVKVYTTTQRTSQGEYITGSRNTIYVGGLVGKNEANTLVISVDEQYTSRAVIQTIQDDRNEKYSSNHYSYYNGNITFESEEMNVRGIININTDTTNYINPIGIGGIAGYSNGEILNIASEATINTLNTKTLNGAENVGGIVGINNNAILNGVYFSGKLSGTQNIGGICGTFSGYMENGIVEFMDSEEDDVMGITGIVALNNVGALCGYVSSMTADPSTIEYSFARSYFVRKMTQDNFKGDIYVYVPENEDITEINVGGLVGLGEYLNISKSYSYLSLYIDDIYNKGNIGGILGYSNNSVSVMNCYARGLIYISYTGKAGYNVTAISNNVDGYQAGYFYSDMGVFFGEDTDYQYVGTNIINRPDINVGVRGLDDIGIFSLWDDEIWGVEDHYNGNLPYIIYKGKKMLTEPPESIDYIIKASTINSNLDLYKLNKFIKVDERTILLFKYDDEYLDSYNLNKILDFSIPPYYIGGVAQFEDMTTIRLKIKSSDTSIAVVNSNGTLTVYGEGTVVITIQSMLNKNAKADINIVVMNVTTGFNIYKDNLFINPIESGETNRLLIKKGTNLEIYPYISGNSDAMIEYSVNSTIFYPIMFANAGEWVQKDLSKSCMDIAYSGTHVIMAINPGTTTIEAKLFVYINGTKVYLPYTKTFTVQSFEGLNDFTISHSSFDGIVKDRYEFTVKITTDIADRTVFVTENLYVDGVIESITLTCDGRTYRVNDILDVTTILIEQTHSYVIYAIYVEINDDYKACDIFFDIRNFRIRCMVDDGQNIDYGIEQQLDVDIRISPQDISAIETMFFSGAEVVYDNDLSNPMYNVAEVDTDVITAGEIGIFKVFIYPEFSKIKNIYIYASSTDGKFMSIEQVALRKGTVPGQNTYFTLSPAPAQYSTVIAGTVYQGLHANIVSNVVVEDSIIQKSTFDGYLYFRCLTGSDVELGTIYTIYVRVETYDEDKAPLIKRTLLYAEERIGITLFYEDSINNNNFSFITSYNEKDTESTHTLQFITRRLGENPRIQISFFDEKNREISYIDENGVVVTPTEEYKDNPIYYIFHTEDKTVETENISYRYYIKDLQLPAIFEGTTISVLIKATDVEDNNLIYYSNYLYLRVVPYLITDIVVDGVNNQNEFIKSYGGNYTLNVNITTSGICKNDVKMKLKKDIATSGLTWWYYDYNELKNEKYFTTLQAKDYEFFTISKSNAYYVYTPNFVGFTDRIYMVATLSYYKGDADNPAGYVLESNAGPISTERGVNATSQSISFVMEFIVSSVYRNNEDQALPIYDKEGLENMEEGVYYILDNDIVLDEWTPINTAIASLDGNGYEINITSFKTNVEETIDLYLGLFSEVASNTVLKNLYITYGKKNAVDEDGYVTGLGENVRYEFALDSTALTTLYFGGVAGINNGIIYNCSVKNASEMYYMEFMRTDTREVLNYDVKIAGLVGLNKGYISYSRCEMTLLSNVGNMAGLVSENRGTLSSSYYKNNKITNNSTNSSTSKVAGVCVTNTSTGEIYYTYVEGTPAGKNELQYTGGDSGLTFAGNIAGFVYDNSGIISDCYANIPIRPAGGRNAGFVYTNMTGTITCCYTLCKFIYQNNNGTNASDTPFVGTDAQGNVNYDPNKSTLSNVYYYIGDFIKSVTDKEPAQSLTKVQFMEDYYFGKFSFSYNDGSYNNYSYETAYDIYEEGLNTDDYLTNQNSYAGLDAVWTYDEYHLSPKLVEANNIAVSRKQVSFKPFTEVINYYTTLAVGYSNLFTVSTNKLEKNQQIKLEITNSANKVLFTCYSSDVDYCSVDEGLSTYYISIYNFNITPGAEVIEPHTQVGITASVVIKDKNIILDDNNKEIYTDEYIRSSDRLTLGVTSEDKFNEVVENETYSDEVELSMNVEYSTISVTGVKVSEKLNGISLYSAEPGTRGNPEIIGTATQYNSVMYQSEADVNKGIEFSGNYRIVANIDFSNTNIDEHAVNNVFSGTFDGAGFTLEGLTLIDYSKSIDSFGLFNTVKGSAYGTGVVKNVRLVPLKVYANYIFTVGTLSAKVVGGRVYNIIVDAEEVTVKGKNIVGGVIGMVLDNIKINQKYYEFLSDDLVGTKTLYKSIVQNITSTINVNATSRVSSTNYFLISNINSQKTSFYEQNVKVAYAGSAIGAVISSSGTNRLNKAGVYDIKVIGKSIAVGEIIGTAIGFIGEKSYVDMVNVQITTDQYLNASLIAGGIVGENRGLISRATITHADRVQEIIDKREKENKEEGNQNITFFKNAILSIGGIVGFNNGGVIENSYSRIDVRNNSTMIAGGLAGLVVSGEFYNSYVSGSVYAKTIIGGIIGATSTPELVAPPQTAINATASLISSDSNSQISQAKEVILDSVLGLNKWLEIDYKTFYNKVHNSNDEVTDAYPIGSVIGSIQLNSKDETSSYDITTYSCQFKRLYIDVDVTENKYFKIYDYGNKTNSLNSGSVAYSNTQNSEIYENNYADEIADEKVQNNFAFKDYSTTIWQYTDRASTTILPKLRTVSNLNTKKATLQVKFIDTDSVAKEKTMLLIDGVNGEESATKPLGTTYNPYKIVAPSQLRYFAIHDNIITNNQFKENKLYLSLSDNISLVAYSNWIPIGDGVNDYKITVVFEGNNYQISGITAESATTGSQERFVGLFGYLQTGSIVSNLRTKVRYNLELEGGNIYVGGIVATAYNTSIKNCEVEGKINFLNKYAAYFSIGGIAGQMVSEGGSSSIENSNSYVVITSKDIVSRVTSDHQDSVYSKIQINAKVGGIAGFNQNSIISGCTNSGDITIYPVKGQTPLAFTEPTYEDNQYIKDEYADYSVFKDVLYIGGIVGSNVGQIKESTNYGSIYSYSYAGGIAGINTDNGQVPYEREAFNINECINAGNIYLTAGYPAGSVTAYAGGIAAYSSGSINKSINLSQVYVKTYCQFSVGGIAGAYEKSENAYISHSYVSAYTAYNNTKNVIVVDSITKYNTKTSVSLVYGTSGTNSASIPNKAGLICNTGTQTMTHTNAIYDNLCYGDISVSDPTGDSIVLASEVGSNVDGNGRPTGLVDSVTAKYEGKFILEGVVSKVSTNQTTYGCLTAGKSSKIYGQSSTKNDITYWEKNFFSVPDYIAGGGEIHLSELRWNAKVFTMEFNFRDPDNSDPETLYTYIQAYLINPETQLKEPITPGEETSFYLATTKGYIQFELQEDYKIYYILIRRSDSNDYYEFNESDLISTIITVNGYDYGNKSVLLDLSPGKDVKFTFTIRIKKVV